MRSSDRMKVEQCQSRDSAFTEGSLGLRGVMRVLDRVRSGRTMCRAVVGLCGVLIATGPAVGQEMVEIGIANTASDVGFYLAQSKGYFREANIRVNFNSFASAAQMIAPF